MQGVRLTTKTQIIKGVPRIANTRVKELYWLFRGLSVDIAPGQLLAMVSRDPERTAAAMRVWAGLLPLDEGSATAPRRAMANPAAIKAAPGPSTSRAATAASAAAAAIIIGCSTRRNCSTPYRVVYLVRGEELILIAFAHQSRQPTYWAGRVDG